jgi:hypothetical protein
MGGGRKGREQQRKKKKKERKRDIGVARLPLMCQLTFGFVAEVVK